MPIETMDHASQPATRSRPDPRPTLLELVAAVDEAVPGDDDRAVASVVRRLFMTGRARFQPGRLRFDRSH